MILYLFRVKLGVVFGFQARRVIVYLGRAKPERLVDEMMNELRTIEALTFNVERTQTPPYFRLCVRRLLNCADEDNRSHDGSVSALTGKRCSAENNLEF